MRIAINEPLCYKGKLIQVNEIELITDWELAHKQEEGLLR